MLLCHLLLWAQHTNSSNTCFFFHQAETRLKTCHEHVQTLEVSPHWNIRKFYIPRWQRRRKRRHWKVTLSSLKLQRDYSNWLTLFINVGEPSRSWIPKYSSLNSEREIRLRLLTYSRKREIRQFHFVVVQLRQRNVPKWRVARAKLFVLLI